MPPGYATASTANAGAGAAVDLELDPQHRVQRETAQPQSVVVRDPARPRQRVQLVRNSEQQQQDSRYPNGLTPELRRQRERQAAQTSRPPLRAQLSRPPTSPSPTQSRQRMDSYINESGYPQTRPESQSNSRSATAHAHDRHGRDHLAPYETPERNASSTSTGSVRNPVITRDSSRGHRRSLPSSSLSEGERSASHIMQVVGENRQGDRPESSTSRFQRGGGARAAPSRFAASPRQDQGGRSPSAYGSRQVRGSPRGGGSSSQRTGRSSSNPTSRRPTGMSRRGTAAASPPEPVKPRTPPPATMLDAQGNYTMSLPLHTSLPLNIQSSLSVAATKEVKKATLVDYERYLSPMVRALKLGQKSSSSSNSARGGLQAGEREDFLHRTKYGMMANSTVPMRGKVQVVSKIEASV